MSQDSNGWEVDSQVASKPNEPDMMRACSRRDADYGICPDCKRELIIQGNCPICPYCGWSKC